VPSLIDAVASARVLDDAALPGAGISLKHLELVVGVAKKFSKDFGIDERSRLMFI
jgi:hypothetical protein